MSDIAPLESISNSLDTVSKFIRIMGKEVDSDDLFRVVNDKAARHNLVAFLKAGCPKLTEIATAVQKTLSVLALENDNIVLPALTSPFDPRAVLKTREGLWVSSEFESRVLSQAGVVDKLDSATCSSYDLKKNLYDREITTELQEGYEWDASEACARIAQLIERQPGGREGDLLYDGRANLFYVPGCVVGVDWGAGRRKWFVSAWELDDFHWRAGGRVFVRN